MPKPLRSESVERSQDNQFKHFGVLNSGEQSKSSVFTSITVNAILVILAIIVSASVKKLTDAHKKEELTYAVIPKVEPPKPPPPKIVPPKLPPPPKVEPPKIEPPKIVKPDIKIPDPPKPVPVKMDKPMPVMKEAPPKVVVAAAAPKPTTVNLGQAASVPNADRNPSAVRLGQSNNPIQPSDRPATSAVNLGRAGLAGMPASNTGGGPRSATVNLGSGQPNGSMNGGGARAVAGVKLGVAGSNGTGLGNATGNSPRTVALGQATPPPSLGRPPAEQRVVGKNPTVISKPRPVYTADATAAHVEGTIQVRIRVSSSGTVTVLSVTGGLGHGLDAEARRVAEGTRFRPATDASGSPIDWEGVESVTFQLAG